jgi:hypothetical protein
MTVQELITKLQEFKPETKVVFSHTDHTDFTYNVEMCEEDISLDDASLYDDEYDEDDYDEDDYDEDEDTEEEEPQVVVFTLSLY